MVESERIEFKASWDADSAESPVIRSRRAPILIDLLKVHRASTIVWKKPQGSDPVESEPG